MHRSRTERVVTAGVSVLAVALVVGGAVAWRQVPASFGWFAYAPLSEESVPELVYMDGGRYAALAALAFGLLLLAGLVGFLLGRRLSRPEQTQ
jgi:heme/copper-type cytochrome/quinol oxidase subunit 1